MTEDDARKKWCPFARVVPQDGETFEMGPAGNRIQLQTNGKTISSGAIKTAMCLASSCMAWRQQATNMVKGMELGSKGEILKPGRPVMGGFCGLAGRPE